MNKKVKKAKDKNKEYKKSRGDFMIKQIAWNTFKNTGDINTFLEFIEVKNMEKNIDEEENGNIQNKWDNNIGK